MDKDPPTHNLTTNVFNGQTTLKATVPVTLSGRANDVGRAPLLSRPTRLEGGTGEPITATEKATVWLEPDSVLDYGAGTAVAWLGDIDGDARADLAVGLPAAENGAGKVTILHGRGGGFPVKPDVESLRDSPSSFTGVAGAGIGALISPAGDTNGDGFADLLLADPANDRVFLIFGQPHALGRLTLDGPMGGWREMMTINDPSLVAAAGDVNGDGLADVLIGAGSKLYLVLGRTASQWPWDTVPVADDAAAVLDAGTGVTLRASGVGNIDGVRADGKRYDSFAVGASNKLHLFTGAPGYDLRDKQPLTLSSTPAATQIGPVATLASSDGAPSIVALGDANGDGLDDFAFSNGATPKLVLGRASGSWAVSRTFSYAGLSGTIYGVGDVNADGRSDLLLGATSNRAYLVPGTTTLGSQAPDILATLSDVASAASAPYSAGADLNCDDSADLLLVPPAVASAPSTRTELALGAATRLDPAALPQGSDVTGARPRPSSAPGLSSGTALDAIDTHYVDDDGCSGCSTTIQAAVDAARAGDTVYIYPGVYASFAITGTIKNDLHVEGAGADTVFVDGGGSAYGVHITGTIGVHLSNLTLRNVQDAVRLDNAGQAGLEVASRKIVIDHIVAYGFVHALSMDRSSTLDLSASTLGGVQSTQEHIVVDGIADPHDTAQWSDTLATDMPAGHGANSGGAMVEEGGKLYSMPSQGSTALDAYDTGAKTWTSLAEGPANVVDGPRLLAGGDNGYLYVLRRNGMGGGANGNVNAMVQIGSDIYVGGEFTSVTQNDGSTLAANRVARWDGTQWYALSDGTNGAVYALAERGGKLIVGGAFTAVTNGSTGVGVSRIAEWDPVTEYWSTLNAAFNNAVRSIAVSGSDIYAGGDFTAAEYASKFGGDWRTWVNMGYPSAPIGFRDHCPIDEYQVAVFSVENYGTWSFPDGDTNWCARINPGDYPSSGDWDSNAWNTDGTEYTGSVNDQASSIAVGPLVKVQLYKDNDHGGTTTTMDGCSTNFMGGDYYPSWTECSPEPDTSLNNEVTGIKITLDPAMHHLAKLSGTTWSALDSGVNGSVHALEFMSSTLYIGGSFTKASGLVVSNIVAWNGSKYVTTSGDPAMSEPFSESWAMNGAVEAIVSDGSRLYVGGSMTTVDYRYYSAFPGGSDHRFLDASRVAVYDPATWTWSALGSAASNGVTSVVRGLVVASNTLYATGDFTQTNDAGGATTAGHIAAWNTSTSRWSAIGGGVNGAGRAIALDGDDVYVGGEFTAAGSVAASAASRATRFAPSYRYAISTNAWSRWTFTDSMLTYELRDHAAAVNDGAGHVYVLAGDSISPTTFYRYTIASGAWTARASLPGAAGSGAALAMGTRGGSPAIYALRGNNSADLYAYSPAANTWTSLASQPFKNDAAQTLVFGDGAAIAWGDGGYLYAQTGGSGTYFLRYRAASDAWERGPNVPAQVRAGASLVRYGANLYATVGNNSAAFYSFGQIAGDTPPQKLTLSKVAFVAPNSVSAPSWLRPITSTAWQTPTTPLSPVNYADDFAVGASGVQWVGGGSAWQPTAPLNPAASTITLAQAKFLDTSAAHPVYRMRSGSTLTAGYYSLRGDAHVSPAYGAGRPNDGYTWGSTAFSSIQAAIDSGAQRVLLGPGVYRETFNLANGVQVFGAGADATIIKAPSGSTAVALVRAEGVADARLSKVTLDGGGTIKGLLAEQGAVGILVSRNIVRNTTTAISQAGATTQVEVANNTIVNNTNGIVATNCANPDVRNTVFAYNTANALQYDSCASNGLHTYNAYFANTVDIYSGGAGRAADGPGEIGIDPSFSDPAANDYRPLTGSPLIDAGSPSDATPPGTGARVDIGYVEAEQAGFYADLTFCETCDNAGLTWQVDAFDRVQDAVDAAAAAAGALGDEPAAFSVGVGPGAYAEGVTLPSHVYLFGSGAEKTSLSGAGTGAVVTITAATDVELRGFKIDNSSNNSGILIKAAAHAITLTRNIIGGNSVGVDVLEGASGVMATFNTVVTNTVAGLRVHGSTSWATTRDSIFAGNSPDIQTSSGGQVFSDYNLYSSLPTLAGAHDKAGAPQFAGSDLSLLKASPAVDAAEASAGSIPGGGLLPDMGYRELVAPPLVLMFGREGASCAFGNSGVSKVEIGLSGPLNSTQAGQPVTSTLPSAWYTATLSGQAGNTARYWSGSVTPASEGFYRFYARATDAVANQEKPVDWYPDSAWVVGQGPTVAWLSPASGATTSEAAIEVRAQATDYTPSGGVASPSTSPAFEVDGVSFTADWLDPAGVQPRRFRAMIPLSSGSHSVVAVASDQGGNKGSAAAVTITANTPGPVATITEPITGTATNNSAIAVFGYARFPEIVGTPVVTVTVNGANQTATIESPTALLTSWTATVTLNNGLNTLSASAIRMPSGSPLFESGGVYIAPKGDVRADVAAAGPGLAAASTVLVIRDEQAPDLNVSSPAPGSLVSQATFTVTGNANDPGGVQSVDASLDGGTTWKQASLSTTTGAYTVTLQAPAPADYASINVILRASDSAGNERLRSHALVFDNVPPAPLAPTFSVAPGAHFSAASQVTASWTRPADGSGPALVRVVVDHVADTRPSTSLGQANSPLVASFNAPGLWYIHFSATDTAGNAVTQHYGPWYVDDRVSTTCSSRQASILVNGMIGAGSGATDEWSVSNEMLDVDARSGRAQTLFATWDAANLYLGWRGASWSGEGSLWAYVSTGAAGANIPVSGAFVLPFAADYAIQVDSPVSGKLWHYSSGAWQLTTLTFAHSGRDSEVRLPWTLSSVSNLRLLAYAASDAGQPWAVFPTTNPVAGGWTSSYLWAAPCSVTAPNAGQPQARYAVVGVTSPQDQTLPLGANDTIQYNIRIQNPDTRTLSGASLQLAASAGLSYQSVTGITCASCATPANPWTLSLPDIAAGATLQLTVTARLAASLTGIQAAVTTLALNLPAQTVPGGAALMSHRVDSVAPSVDLLTTYLRRGAQTLYGTASDGVGIGVERVEIMAAALGINSYRPVSGTISWSSVVSVPQSLAAVDVLVRGTDKHGLTSSPRTYHFDLDVTPPTVTFTLPALVVGSIDLAGTASDPGPVSSTVAAVQIQIDSATSSWLPVLGPHPSAVGSSQNWSFMYDLPAENGVSHLVRARAIDGAGNVAQPTSWQTTVDYAAVADLAVTKTLAAGLGPVLVPGTVVTYSLVASNLGPGDASGRTRDRYVLVAPVSDYTHGRIHPAAAAAHLGVQ